MPVNLLVPALKLIFEFLKQPRQPCLLLADSGALTPGSGVFKGFIGPLLVMLEGQPPTPAMHG